MYNTCEGYGSETRHTAKFSAKFSSSRPQCSPVGT